MELTTKSNLFHKNNLLFMMSKIQNLNGTHNCIERRIIQFAVVCDIKDTKFEWNSQLPPLQLGQSAGCL